MSKGCYCCDLSIMYYPFVSIVYAYVLSYVRFNLKVRSQGLLKHVTAVHARGNTWGGWHVLDGIVVTVLMQVTNTPAETLQILIECIPNRKIIQVHVLAPWWSIQTTTTCWCHLVATTISSPLVGDIPH